jgi:hypothetical protein
MDGIPAKVLRLIVQMAEQWGASFIIFAFACIERGNYSDSVRMQRSAIPTATREEGAE